MKAKNLNIIFMGTPDFAVPSLDILLKNRFHISGVITAPDKPAGRGLKMRPSPVKEYASENKLNILQPKNLKNKGFHNELKSLNADVQVIVAFRMLPEAIWDMPPLGSINLHASLLPDYRGAAPINWTIINGEKETGVTTFFLKHEIDTGDIIFQEKVSIDENETAGDLHDKLSIAGASLILKTVNAIAEDQVKRSPQNLSGSHKKAPKIFKEDCRIDWNKDVHELHNFIRGLSPFPTAWTKLDHKTFKIYEASKEIDDHLYSHGKIITDHKNYLKVAVGGGFINLIKVQIEGKKTMDIKSFLNGYVISNDYFQVS